MTEASVGAGAIAGTRTHLAARAYRFHRELGHGRVFELDHPETSSWKQACVRRMLPGLPDHVCYVPINFDSETLAAALAAARFDPTLRTFFLWEGVTMYLRPNAVDDVLSLVARSAEGSAVAFDFLYADAITHPQRFEGATAQRTFAASRGEPFTFGLSPAHNDLASCVKARGLELAKSWTIESSGRSIRARFVAQCEQITTLHKDEVRRQPLGGALPQRKILEVERAVLRAIGVPVPIG